MDYIPEEPEILRVDHWEVWQVLPPCYAFLEVPARNPKRIGLQAKAPGVYVWVMPDAVDLIRGGYKGPFLGLGSRTCSGIDFVVVPVSTKDPVEFAQEDNARKLAEILARKAK